MINDLVAFSHHPRDGRGVEGLYSIRSGVQSMPMLPREEEREKREREGECGGTYNVGDGVPIALRVRRGLVEPATNG